MFCLPWSPSSFSFENVSASVYLLLWLPVWLSHLVSVYLTLAIVEMDASETSEAGFLMPFHLEVFNK